LKPRRALVLPMLLASLLLSGCIPAPLDLLLDQVSRANVHTTGTTHEATCTASDPLGLDSVTRVIISRDKPNGELDEVVARDTDFAKKLALAYREFNNIAAFYDYGRGYFFVSTLEVLGAQEEDNSIHLYASETYAFYRLRDGKAIAEETVPLLPAEVVIDKNLRRIRTIEETGVGSRSEMAADLANMMPEWARERLLSLQGDSTQIDAAQALADQWATTQE